MAAFVIACSCHVSAATWTDVYYELGNHNTVTGANYIAPAHITDNTGQAIDTIQSIDGKASIYAYAAPGVLKTSTSDSAAVNSIAFTGVSDYSFTTTQATFFDQLTVTPTDSSLLGQTGTLNAYLLLSGSMSDTWYVQNLNTPSYTNVSASSLLQIGGTGITGFIQARDIQGYSGGSLTDVTTPAPRIIQVSFSTTFGSPTGIQYFMNLQGTASASFGFRECGGGYGPCGAMAGADQLADFSHTLLWGGISGITDASGNFIDFMISSESGFDYASAVPVPAAFWMFVSGLAGMVGAARRKPVAHQR